MSRKQWSQKNVCEFVETFVIVISHLQKQTNQRKTFFINFPTKTSYTLAWNHGKQLIELSPAKKHKFNSWSFCSRIQTWLSIKLHSAFTHLCILSNNDKCISSPDSSPKLKYESMKILGKKIRKKVVSSVLKIL